MISPEQAVEVIHERFGRHPGQRALHAKGIVCRGTFVATPAAAALTRAAHLQGDPVEVVARLSNGSGDPAEKDYAPGVRGLAVAFELSDGSRPVISAQTVPEFPVRTPDAFIDLLKAVRPGIQQALLLPYFLLRNPGAIGHLRANAKALNPPRSYATVPYFAVHAFTWVAADGTRRSVRYRWLPQAGEQRISPAEGKKGGADYLTDELRTRLGREPVRFDLHVQIAQPGDSTSDPSAQWPADRELVHAGTLEITDEIPEPDVLVFDPTSVTDGIELSDDPVLLFRSKAYTVSIDHRLT